MAVHESPLQRGSYRVWLSIPYHAILDGDATKRLMLFSFRMSTAPGTGGSQFTWKQRSSVLGAPNERADRISYSGHRSGHRHTQVLVEPNNGLRRILQPDVHSSPITLEIPEGTRGAHLVHHSGALTYTTTKTIVLRYFDLHSFHLCLNP